MRQAVRHSFVARALNHFIAAAGNATHYGYDAYGNLAAVTNALGGVTVYEYDLRGNKTYEGGATYPVRYTYDIFGNKTTMTTYRNAGGPTSVSAAGDVTTWLYDIASGSMTNKVYADGNGPTYTYTPDGKPSRRIWARGIVTDYSYDNWGNLTNTVYSDGTPTIALSYDALGRQTEAHDAAGITTFIYDSFGSLTNEAVFGVAGTNIIIRHWDNFGRNAGYALNGTRQSTLAYDSATGRLASMLADGSETSFVWNYLDGSDLKSSLAYPNGLTATWTYDANNLLLQVCNATPTNIISQYDYTYDAAGRRVACGKSGSAFAQDDTVAYAYNNRSELTNAVAAVDSDYRYAYYFDEIGNRETSSERGTNSVYAANQLNQYTAIDDLTPQFDDDGNQTLVKTVTGIWLVTYNGENRPILWENVSTNSSTPPLISMSFDRMGRRVTKNDQRFVYNGYLQIADNNGNAYVWDPAEKIATRPLVWNSSTFQPFNFSTAYYTHDGNKNVDEVVTRNGDIAAHYEYAPFGAVIAQRGVSVAANPWRFSSEYAEDDTVTVYYNYRHYDPVAGRWSQRDLVETEDISLMLFVHNASICDFDYIGLASGCKRCSDHLIDLLKNEDDLLLDGFKGLSSLGGRCRLLYGCDTNCTSSSMRGYTSYSESGILWWKDATITIRICANADGSLKNTENETRNTLIHELSHAADLCMTQNPFRCGSIGSDDMKRLICTEVRAYRYGNGIKDKSQCIERALNSVQSVCPHKRGTWAEYRSALRREAEGIYDDCIKEVIR